MHRTATSISLPIAHSGGRSGRLCSFACRSSLRCCALRFCRRRQAPTAPRPQRLGQPIAVALADATPGPPYGNMNWREIGPATAGGRVAAVAGSATDPKLYYVGSGGGGVWKSANCGQTWDPVFAKEPVAAIGAVTIDPTDNDTVWVGTGEDNPRNDVSYGDGVYKTTDGGDTWTQHGSEARPNRFRASSSIRAITITWSSPRTAISSTTAPIAAST